MWLYNFGLVLYRRHFDIIKKFSQKIGIKIKDVNMYDEELEKRVKEAL
jgi:hypothetical protein